MPRPTRTIREDGEKASATGQPEMLPADPGRGTRRPIRARALVVGVLLIPPLLYWQLQLELKRYSFPTWAVPFYHVIFMVWWLALGNLALRRWRPRAALTGGEVVAVYVMLSIAAAFFSIDLMGILVATIAYPYQYPSSANQYLPSWLVVQDAAALAPYYRGGSTLYQMAHLRAWAVPLCAWGTLLFVLLCVTLGLTVLLRRAWTENEHLSYPVVRLPMELAGDTGAFLRQRALWAGFALAAIITTVNGLHFWFPTIPAIPVKRQDLAPFFPGRPWNAIGWTEWSMYPFAIGLLFFVPLDLSFSIWFFFLVHKAELVAASAAGWDATSKFPYPYQQSVGAFLGILALSLWTGRGHFRGVLRAALYHPKNPEERLWRWALVVVAAGSLFLLGFAMLAGMSAGVAALFLGLYFALVIMLTRIRAEMGFPVHDLNGCPPDQTLVMVLGPAVLGPANVTGLALFHWFVRSLGFISHPMPHQLEAFKMADATGAGRRSMGGAMLLAGVVGIVGGFWLYLHRYYSVGADSAYWNGWTVQLGRETFTLLGSWLNSPADPDRGAAAATGFGFFLALALSALRLRLGRFPMHPLGYAVAPSWGMANLWSCVFLAWVAKTVILRSAGLKGYRRASPFFLGLVLGEFVCGAGWTLLGVLFDQPSYDFWP